MDKTLIVAGIGKFDSRPYGALKVEGGKIVDLNRAIIFNEARACYNAGANTIRAFRCGFADWTEMGPLFDWDDANYAPLFREFLQILHQPFQGSNPPPGGRVWIDPFIGCSESWMYDPKNYGEARELLGFMLDITKDLPFVDMTVGNEMNQPEARAFCREVVFPVFKAEGRIPFALGASYCHPGAPGPMEWQKAEAEACWKSEDIALNMWKPIHKVTDETSDSMRIALDNWLRPHQPQVMRVLLSVDGSMGGESPDDYSTYKGKIQRRPSVEQIKRAIGYWMDNAEHLDTKDGKPAFGFEYLPKAMKNEVTAKGIAAISDMHKKRWGIEPENRGKYPSDYVKPVIVVPPIVIDDPIIVSQKCSVWYHLQRLNFRAAWAHLMGKHAA